jgi:glycine/D-amino acid oxidase-like deaminating enzyme
VARDRFRPPRTADPVDRSLWMQEALADESAGLREPRPLHGDLDCDVAIVGGGFTGLWTALRLSEDEPDLRIAVLEAGICGAGASGRNGGFATSWWHDLDAFVTHFGDDQALFLCGASSDAIDTIERFGAEHDLELGLRRAGKISAATCAAQLGAWDTTIAAAERLGVPERFRRVDGDEAGRRIGSPVLGAGMFMADSASIQPARLVRGLRRVLRERGVAIHEQTPMVALDRRQSTVITTTGRVRAPRIVLAVNAWAAALPEIRRVMVPLSSHVVVTEPIPERIAALGWTGGELLLDGRMLVHYAHVTGDGRIAFGRGGGAVAFGDRISGRVLWDAALAATVADDLRWFFPSLADVRIDAAWGRRDRPDLAAPAVLQPAPRQPERAGRRRLLR